MSFYEQTAAFLSREDADEILESWPGFADRYKENPYSLLELKRTDETQYASFFDVDTHTVLDTFQRRKQQMRAAISCVLERNEADGNSYMDYKLLASRVIRLLIATGHPLLRGTVAAYLDAFQDVFFYDRKKQTVGFHATRMRELAIYRGVHRAKRAHCRFPAFLPSGETLSDEQYLAARNIIRQGGNIAILRGGPGTGKTTTLKSVVRGIRDGYPGTSMVLLAPTGRAVKRIKESFAGELSGDDTTLPVRTVHSFVGWGHKLQKWEAEAIRATDIIIIDESSMLDAEIFETLLSLIDVNRTKLVLVGDADQLPAIGVGDILNDLIADGVHTETLTHNFRSSGPIEGNAVRLQTGNPFPALSSDFTFMECPKSLIAEMLSILRKDGNDVILSPYRSTERSGNIGDINRAVQVKNNHFAEWTQFGGRFNHGDAVMLTSTNYKKGYYNGDIGTMVGYDSEKDGYVVRLDDSDGGHREVIITEDNAIELAYAVTIHKSQGSEYPCVDIVIPEYSAFITKRMLYTAVTRAKQKVRLWTDAETYRKIVLTPEPKRRTFYQCFTEEDAA
jgi:ATP-dependent exoDNAse (exonuclease V) alpha subunit